MKCKRIIAYIICLFLIIPSLGTSIVTMAMDKSGEPLVASIIGNPDESLGNTYINNDINDSLLPSNIQIEQSIISPDGGENVIYESSRESLVDSNSLVNDIYNLTGDDAEALLGDGGSYSSDVYNLTEDDIKTLLIDGYTIQDIYKADDIGNNSYIDPKELLSRMRASNISLEEAKNEIIVEQKNSEVQILGQKHPDEYSLLMQEGLNDDQIFLLLSVIDIYHIQCTMELIQDFKVNGENALDSYIDPSSVTVSQEKMDEYNLTPDDVKGLTDETLDKLVTVANKMGISVKDAVEQFNSSQY